MTHVTLSIEGLDNPAIFHGHDQTERNGVQTGMRILLKDVSFSVPSFNNKSEKAFLLRNVDGYFEPGQITALMGPSGSGKTTLLDLLAGRKTYGRQVGTILYGGHAPSPEFLRRYTGYVEQQDTLVGTLTIYEMLMYTAEMKQSHKECLQAKRKAVEDLLVKLGLESCRDVRIGGAMHKGISGGQAKRTNIGIALITNPRVLFLDEPTSGLDSFTSNEVMTVVKSLTTTGDVTIVATIHSPTAYAFSLFDSVMMLARGEVVYFGPRGPQALDLIQGSGKRGVQMAGSSWSTGNDAEALVDLITHADRQGRAHDLALEYQGSDIKKAQDAKLSQYMLTDHQEVSEEMRGELAVKRATVTPWWWGMRTMIKYRTSRNFCDPTFLLPRILDKAVVGLLILTLYLGLGDDMGQDNFNNIAAVLFMWTVLPAYGAAPYMPAIVLERPLFIRERADGLYRVITYLLTKMVDELVLAAMVSLAVGAAVFFAVQLQGSFLVFWLTYLVMLALGIILAYLISALSPNLDAANAALPTYVTTMLFFGGLLLTFRKMPDYWRWYSWVNPVRYAWGALMVNQFEGRDALWFGDQTVLDYFGLVGLDKWASLGYLSLFFVVFLLATWVVMSVRKYGRR